MSIENHIQSQNGHHKPRSETRVDVLELDAKRKTIENEILEYHQILRSVLFVSNDHSELSLFYLCYFSKELAWMTYW